MSNSTAPLFDRLVNGQRHYMVAYIQSVRNRDFAYTLSLMDAEEVYDDACCTLWGKLQRGEVTFDPHHIVGYLAEVCRYTALHYLRGLDLCPSFDDILEHALAKDYEDEFFQDLYGEDSFQHEMRMSMMDRLLSRLTENERKLLHLCYWGGDHMDEIAKQTCFKNAASAKTKKNKLLNKLRQWVKEEQSALQSDNYNQVA